MNFWQIVLLVGTAAGTVGVHPNQQGPTPPSPETTWHCRGNSQGADVDIEVDSNGKGEYGEVTWRGHVGDSFSIDIMMDGYFDTGSPNVIHSRMMFLTSDMSDKKIEKALRGHKYRWSISTRSDSGDGYPNFYSGTSAFTGPLIKFGSTEMSVYPGLRPEPDDFLALARGSEHLFLVARDKDDKVLLRSRLSIDHLLNWTGSAQAAARQAIDKISDYSKSCERDDHDQIVV